MPAHNPTVDRALIGLVALATLAAFAWLIALTLVVAAARGNISGVYSGAGLAVAATSTVTVVRLSGGYQRKREHVEALETLDMSRREIVEAVAAMACDMEQISAKVENAGWAAWRAGIEDREGAVVPIRSRRSPDAN